MNTTTARYLITIVGPTAIGKTALSIVLAQYFKCDIISADSRQFYREMPIGTAAPNEQELAAAVHHFVHHKSIHDLYTVGDFEKEALRKLETLYQDNAFAIMVGGSGLYVDAVLKGFDVFPEIDPAVRATLKEQYAQSGLQWLQQELCRLDPVYFDSVDQNNPQRLMRALEVCIGSGKPYSDFLNVKKHTRNFIPILIGLDAERPLLYDRINTRVSAMIANGLPEEARQLYPYKERNALQTVGYREIFDYLDGAFTLEHAIAEIKKNTRRFSKRQLTWFKRNGQIRWFDYQEDPMAIIAHIQSVTDGKRIDG